MNSLTVFDFNSNNIRFENRNGRVWVCLTDMAKASGKKVSHWNQLDSTKAYISYAESVAAITAIESRVGGNIPENQRGTWAIEEVAIKFAEWCSVEFEWWVKTQIKTLMKECTVSLPQVKPRLPQEVTDHTLEVHGKLINQFECSGDLQLAQLLKSRLGNLILAEQQTLLKPIEVEQYEGVVDVAIRLGYAVPRNFEGSLGTFVKKHCEHLLIGQNKRYSTASHKQVPANMYPACNAEVEKAVIEYCVSRAFRHRGLNLLG